MTKYLEYKYLSLILIFSFTLVSCNDTKISQEEIPLKGEKITDQNTRTATKYFNVNSNTNTKFEYYTVNTESKKANKLKRKIKKHFQNINGNSGSHSKSSPETISSPESVSMDDAMIVEDTNSGEETIVTPIDDSNTSTNQLSFTGYDSEKNLTSNETYYYEAETNLSDSELSSIEQGQTSQLPSNAELQVEITNQAGSIVSKFDRSANSSTPSKSKNSEINSNSADEDFNYLGCFQYCWDEEHANMTFFQEVHCAIFGCGHIIFIECNARCLSYTFDYYA